MATKQATNVPEKKRVSKAVKRKAKRVLKPEDDSEDDEPEVPEVVAEEKEAKPEKKKKTKANRFEKMAADAESEEEKVPRGVIYVGHIPDGFMEPQMKKFFSQFGQVTRLRLSRSKKNAKSKGYAFVEFGEESVAKIVAETMQGYLLFDKTLVCHVLPKDKCHPLLFKGHKRRMMDTSGLRLRKHKAMYNDRPTVEVNGEQVPRRTLHQGKRRKAADKKLASTLKDLGVDYDFTGADEGARPKSPKVGASSSPKVGASSSPKVGSSAPPAAAATGAAGSKKKKRKTSA